MTLLLLHQIKKSLIPSVFCPAENIPSAGASNNWVTPVTISLHRQSNKLLGKMHSITKTVKYPNISWRDKNYSANYTHKHPHAHPFNGPLSGITLVSQYQKGKTNLDFTEARDSEWQWHQLGHMQVCTSLQTDNHASTAPLSFLQAGRSSCRPTNSVEALKGKPTVLIKL